MRSILFVLFTAFALQVSAAADPENILPRTKEIRSQQWYHEQALAWCVRAKQSNTRESWINYYTAAKYAQWQVADLNRIIEDAKNILRDDFTVKLITAWHSGITREASSMLKELENISSDHVLLNTLLIMHDELNFDVASRRVHAERLFSKDVVSSSLLSYSYNVLMSIEDGGLLVCDGDNTTIPLFILQDIFDVRRDVIVLNLDLLLDPDYRLKKLAANGIDAEGQDFPDKEAICEWLTQNSSSKKIYYALTLPQQHITAIKDQLYVVGLASQAAKTRLDNITSIRENLENRFLLDNLTVDFSGENQFASGKVLSTNYLVPMLLLFEHYKSVGNNEKLSEWKMVIDKIARETGKEVLVQNFLSKKIAAPFVSAGLDVKAIEGRMKLVKGKIYAGETEVTNLEYNTFLRYLKTNGLDEIYSKSNFDLSQYEEPSLSLMKQYHADLKPVKKQQYHTNYPVINISYAGGQAYCEWLTEQYNNTSGRKFTKVKFRLPTISEWRIAALGYKDFQSWDIYENKIEIAIPENPNEEFCKNCPKKSFNFRESQVLYPWYGAFYIRNKALNNRGCSLGNFKWPDTQKPCRPGWVTVDGWVLTSPVQSYFPNGMGLYDVVGNVAEMINEEGKACGGSWNHDPEQSTILSINEYKGPDASTGFRVFMEVIEP